MSLNDTPSGLRAHIGFFGTCNAGKSSVINAFTGQDLAVVSDTAGTTTDLVRKSMELLPLGPVTVVDTPGIDDSGDLGRKRVERARQALRSCDIAIIVVDAVCGMRPTDEDLISSFSKRGVPYVIAWNKADLLDDRTRDGLASGDNELLVSALTGEGINELKEYVGHCLESRAPKPRLIADLIDAADTVILVVPIDESAPAGRIILPQQMVLRDILDVHAQAVICQPEELACTVSSLSFPPKLVVTDSQAFGKVAKTCPAGIALTSFSILMARYKGDLAQLVSGAARLSALTDGDRVLISEGCTHHRQCNDIGTVKMPGWIEEFCGAHPDFDFTSGREFPEDVSAYSLVVHCGGCMLNDKEMSFRQDAAKASGVPIVNYGIAIAHMHGILKRSLEPFPQVLDLLESLQ